MMHAPLLYCYIFAAVYEHSSIVCCSIIMLTSKPMLFVTVLIPRSLTLLRACPFQNHARFLAAFLTLNLIVLCSSLLLVLSAHRIVIAVSTRSDADQGSVSGSTEHLTAPFILLSVIHP